jgi:hypothetical protein
MSESKPCASRVCQAPPGTDETGNERVKMSTLIKVSMPELRGHVTANADHSYRLWDNRWIPFNTFRDSVWRPSLVTINDRNISYVTGSHIKGVELRMSVVRDDWTVYQYEPVRFASQVNAESWAYSTNGLAYMIYEREVDRWREQLIHGLNVRGFYCPTL